MEESKGSHRTRSKAAPDWTVEESLILVNEINAVESEWGATLPSFQKWQQIVDNCNTLDVNRNLNQCKRKWDTLLSEYRRANNGSGKTGSFHGDLFNAIDKCVNAKGKKSGCDGVDEDAEAASPEDKNEQAVMDTDPDSDPEAHGRVTKFFFETGSKKQKRRMKRKKRRIESLNPWGYFTSSKIKLEESNGINEKAGNDNENLVKTVPEETAAESKEQIMSTTLWENALQIKAILEGNSAEDADYKLADLKNPEAVQIDFARRQGDKLIDYLGKISTALNQLCDLVQQCN